MAWGAIVGGALAGGSLLKSFLDRPSTNTPDISGELNKIRALFDEMRAQATKNINIQAAQGRRASASNLATRGTYSSPVAEHVFGQLEADRINAIANSEAQIGGQEANMRSSLLSQLLGMNQRGQEMRNQADASIWGNIGGLGSSLLMADLTKGPGTPQPNQAPVPQSTSMGQSANYLPQQYYQQSSNPYFKIFNPGKS